MTQHKYITIVEVVSEDPTNEHIEIGDTYIKHGKHPSGDNYQVISPEGYDGPDIVTVRRETVVLLELPHRMGEEAAENWLQTQLDEHGQDAVLNGEVSAHG